MDVVATSEVSVSLTLNLSPWATPPPHLTPWATPPPKVSVSLTLNKPVQVLNKPASGVAADKEAVEVLKVAVACWRRSLFYAVSH